MFENWRPAYETVIALVRDGNREKAAALTMKECSRHVAKLEEKMGELTAYARNKASGFLTKAESIRSREKKLSLGLMAAWMVLSLGVAFFTIRRTRLTEKALADETEKLLVWK